MFLIFKPLKKSKYIMNINNIYIGIIISLILVFIFVMTIAWLEDLKKTNDIYKRAHMDVYAIHKIDNMSRDQYKKIIKINMQNIIKHERETSLLNKLLNSCYNGIIQGGLVGMISGGPIESLTNGLIYGLLNPISMFIQKRYMHNNDLPVDF